MALSGPGGGESDLADHEQHGVRVLEAMIKLMPDKAQLAFLKQAPELEAAARQRISIAAATRNGMAAVGVDPEATRAAHHRRATERATVVGRIPPPYASSED